MPTRTCPCGAPVRPRTTDTAPSAAAPAAGRASMAADGGAMLRGLERWAEAAARDGRQSWQCACRRPVKARRIELQTVPPLLGVAHVVPDALAWHRTPPALARAVGGTHRPRRAPVVAVRLRERSPRSGQLPALRRLRQGALLGAAPASAAAHRGPAPPRPRDRRLDLQRVRSVPRTHRQRCVHQLRVRRHDRRAGRRHAAPAARSAQPEPLDDGATVVWNGTHGTSLVDSSPHDSSLAWILASDSRYRVHPEMWQ